MPIDLESEVKLRSLGEHLDELKLNRRHLLVFAVCAIGFMFDALEFQTLALTAPSLVKEWHLRSGATGVLFTSLMLGMLVGTCIFGTVSDWIGRRTTFQLTVVLFAVFNALSALAQSPAQLRVLCLLSGIGIGGFIPVDTAVIIEYMPRRYRGRILGIWALFLPLGGSVAAWLASRIIPAFGWRAMFAIGIIPGIVVVAVSFLVPETPRFLLTQGRLSEAERSLQWIAREAVIARKPISPAISELAPGKKPLSGRVHPAVSPWDLFSPAYRKRTALTWMLWLGTSFTYYGLLLWMPSLLSQYKGVPLPKVYLMTIVFTSAGLVGRIAVAACIDQVGRKPLVIACSTLAALAALLFGVQTGFTGLLVAGAILGFFIDADSGCKVPWTAELYPTRVRATGVGWATGAGRVGASLAPMIVALLVVKSVQAVFIAFAISCGVAALVALIFGIETRGQPLED